MITGIVVALPEELYTLTSAKVKKGHCYSLNDNLLITLAGAGPENARHAAELLHARHAKRLISWGCAAALAPTFRPGDLVLPDTLVKLGAPPCYCDARWVEHCSLLLGQDLTIHSGALAGSDSIIAGSAEKSALYSQTGAVALDMESYAVAAAAAKAGIPSLAIRAVADPADMSLPDAVGQALNSQGDVGIGRLLLNILYHPLQIPGLIKLGLHFNAAKKTLRSVATNLDKITEFSL